MFKEQGVSQGMAGVLSKGLAWVGVGGDGRCVCVPGKSDICFGSVTTVVS